MSYFQSKAGTQIGLERLWKQMGWNKLKKIILELYHKRHAKTIALKRGYLSKSSMEPKLLKARGM